MIGVSDFSVAFGAETLIGELMRRLRCRGCRRPPVTVDLSNGPVGARRVRCVRVYGLDRWPLA